MTRVSNPLNYSHILPKQTEARKLRITAKNVGKYSMQKDIHRSCSHIRMHITHIGLWNPGSDGNRGLESWLAHLVSSSQKKAGFCGWDPEFRLQSPRFLVWHHSLSQATQTLFASPYNGTLTFPLHSRKPQVKMHYRLQLPLFSSCLTKLLPTKMQ